MIMSGNEPNVAQIAVLHHLMRVLVQRVEADVVADRSDPPAGLGQVKNSISADSSEVIANGFFADHMLASRKDRLHLRVMRVILAR